MRPATTGPPAVTGAGGAADIMSLLQKAQQGAVGAMAPPGTGAPPPQQTPQAPLQATPQAGAGSAATAAGGGGPDGYGILGLLGVIRTPDRDLNVLALGTDLTTLSLNLNTAEPLHASFAHPWTDTPATKEPALTLPSTYRVPQPALKTGHFSKFAVGTLLYIFYSMPRDVLQAYAAQELYNREWRFHRDTKLWFKREAVAADGKGGGGESAYVYWDVSLWERRPYGGPLPALLAGFLPEEEVRIRPPGTAATGATTGAAPGTATGGTAAAAGSS